MLPTSAGQEKGWMKPRSFWDHWLHGFHAQKSGRKHWLCLKHLPTTMLAETSSSPSVGRLQKKIQELAVVWLCRNTIGPAIWRHWSAFHCGCWRIIPHKWEMISYNSKPLGYLATGKWSHTNGKWSHKQATRQKRWVGWILNEIFMVTNLFHWYFAES